MEQIIVQNKLNIPDTHFLEYNAKKYPIKFVFFKYSSKYFSRNEEELKKSQIITLTNVEIPELTEEIIQTFINFVQLTPISMNKENAFMLNYLANKYEVSTLKQLTTEYILNNKEELAIDLIIHYQKEGITETAVYENLISNKFDFYIQKENLINLTIPTLYRIFNNYFKNKKSDRTQNVASKENQIFLDFFFKCLDKYGKEASVLFEFIDDFEITKEILDKLYIEYSSVFDFSFIKTSLLRYLYEKNNQLNEKNNQLNEKK